MKPRALLLILCLCPPFFSLQQIPDEDPQPRARNVILMIGDGMGITQITAGMYMNDNSLNLERIKHIGLIKTYSSSDLITDSAAGATAFSCGIKTYNGAIGVGPEGKPVTNIFEILHERGMGTGIVATSSLSDATPASFYAHEIERTMYEEITTDFLTGTLDIAIGGGRRLFNKREDGRDVLAEMEALGYGTYKSLGKAASAEEDRMLVIESPGHLAAVRRGRGEFLTESSQFAINHLNRKNNGFMLMIEGSQIDWGGHSNDGKYIITEMIDFDDAIGAVLDFAEKDGNTLVVITADHETGGFAIEGGDLENGSIEVDFTTDWHTGTLIPVFAYGPGAEYFTGIYENTGIYYRIKKAMGLDSTN